MELVLHHLNPRRRIYPFRGKMDGTTILQFAPFASAPKVSFWQSLAKKKLEEWQLDEGVKEIKGYYWPGSVKGLPPRLELVASSLETERPHGAYSVSGQVQVLNTLDTFKQIDKERVLKRAATLSHRPSFVLLVFADMKKQSYVYWFGFPGLILSPPAQIANKSTRSFIDEVRSRESQLDQFLAAVQTAFPTDDEKYRQVLFAARFEKNQVYVVPLDKVDDAESEEWLFCCVDPSSQTEPGWPVRTLISFLATRLRLTKAKVACCRSDVLAATTCTYTATPSQVFEIVLNSNTHEKSMTGWEKNAAGRMGPRRVDLAPLTQPAELAASASALNLHLMRWRLLPALQVDNLTKMRCLLLGAGTLGCCVGRTLLGWGVRHITFVDNGQVAYSNPARQWLYTVSDCAQNKTKAEAAACALEQIAPNSTASPSSFTGVQLTIPMPGHTLGANEIGDISRLSELIESHDLVFVLTDTREARWLPTLLATAATNQPTVLNVGLGLDSFVVIRHGAKSNLGCYFCNDIVAPANSTKDRTLDQQCTVARPGLAPIASAIAVELAVALLHHPLGHAAPADSDQNLSSHTSNDPDRPLGMLPHSIRGFLTHFATVAPATQKFHQCSACSDTVVSHYRQDPIGFITKVCADPAILGRITGLDDLASDFDADAFVLDDEDEDLATISSS